ncbi:sugar-binding transcriptional regulator [Agrobacterium rubi]|uniref:Sugar-binding transcriptional regulator n=1 Tax=Agrobacterium rubi TaxID=28099 RepID=A0AAE7R9H9_9HYPH|nr:sugar-binding transcriptional regulator [Agrobacterium rubi]NTE88312.1 sugar-binding transcriptional regulator [Agrobacterium rubi]NTF04078.1 sugar-binding transcriptional regulator [Agrobacterium rubi]NTF38409.1 sugar-binding transcriptional regulator [Agrobacterium rubi]OCJ47308.1 DNA-binding transcriptional regulator [Agrobacterium rubi]QTG02222.1 sugar-binding transcriptional regulator [Agrobacterium rubi]
MTDADETLAVRAAWLHYAGGLTQSEVARRLGVPSVKAHRLIAKAVAEGVVKVTIDGDIVECVELEMQLCERFGLQHCEVAPDLGEEGLPLRALGHAGANYLKREIERGENRVIGLGHGRTLSAAVQYMPRVSTKDLRFVSLLGGLTRNYGANPYDVMHRIAEKTGSQAYVMPVPFFANTTEDRKVLLAQRAVKEVFELANKADLKLVGIGNVDADAQLVSSSMVEPEEIADIAALGGVGEILGHFFDVDGHIVETDLSTRMLSASFPVSKSERLVGLAGGANKVAAISAILKSNRLFGLITDERTAKALLAG